MLRFILCDDNPEHSQLLKRCIQQMLSSLSKSYEIALVTPLAEEALRYARENPEQNVYMLDVMLEQEMDGLQLCQEIRHYSPESYILYVSAYSQYALECCRTHSFDFILKPYSEMRLFRALEDLVCVIESRKPSAPLEIAIGSLVRMVDQYDILYLKTDREYITAYLRNDRITWRESMASFLGRVNANSFFRIHKSYAVNRLALDQIDLSRRIVRLCNGESLPASRRFLSRLRNVDHIANDDQEAEGG